MKHLLHIGNLLLLITVSLLSTSPMRAQLSNDSIVDDFCCFVHYLETTHPDTYTNYGGKIPFYQKKMETIRQLQADTVTTADGLEDLIRTFLLPLHDGHTYISSRSKGTHSNRWALITVKVYSDGLFVETLPETYKAWIGSRLTGINGIAIDSLTEGFSTLNSYENTMGKYRNTAYYFGLEHALKQVIPDLSGDSVTYDLCAPDGKEIHLTLPFLTTEAYQATATASRPSTLSLPQNNLQYAFVDKGNRIMYFRCRQVMAKDCFEYMKAQGMDYYDQLKWSYSAFGTDLPADTAKAIASLPSFSDRFDGMLREMKRNHSDHLIIDLRGNGGGWTPIVLPSLYQMWGDKYLLTDMNTKFYRIISPLLMQKYNCTLEQFNRNNGTDYAFGDYGIEADNTPSAIDETMRSRFIDNWISSVKDKLRQLKGTPVYTPQHVYVITDAGTFSAAFHYAFYLWKMGATIVGVPSSQAPNTYMEQTAFELPHTHLSGSISNSLQLFLPVQDRRAHTFWPDLMLHYEDYQKYHFDKQAEVMYLLDHIAGK